MTLGLMLPQYLRLRSAYKRHDFLVVEGYVTDLRPMPYQGHQDECFTVQPATFCYSDYDVSPGFNNSASHGGPIREGLPVRVSYVGGTILRLEIRTDALPTVAERETFAESAKADWEYRSKQDPLLERMDLGFAIAALFLAGWWNVQPKRFMRFWIKQPYRPWVVSLFRMFFAANLLGAVWYLVRQLVERHGSVSDLRYAALIGAAWILAIWLMVNVVEWVAGRQARGASIGR